MCVLFLSEPTKHKGPKHFTLSKRNECKPQTKCAYRHCPLQTLRTSLVRYACMLTYACCCITCSFKRKGGEKRCDHRREDQTGSEITLSVFEIFTLLIFSQLSVVGIATMGHLYKAWDQGRHDIFIHMCIGGQAIVFQQVTSISKNSGSSETHLYF